MEQADLPPDGTPRLPAPTGLYVGATFLAVWLLVLTAGRTNTFNDPGVFWHVRVGERVLSDGFFSTDPFTYTFAGRTWIPQQWLAECAMVLAHRLDGFDGLLLGAATLLAALFAWLAGRLAAAGFDPLQAGVVIALAVGASAFHFYVRPHLTTIALLGVTYAVLVDAETGRVGPWRLAGLVPLFVVWTNLHGGVLAGIATVGLCVAGWVARRFVGFLPTPTTQHPTPLLLLLLAACAATPWLNPYGQEMIDTWRRIMGSKLLPQVVAEHKPADWTRAETWLAASLALAYGVALAGVPWRNWRVTWLVPAVWFVLAAGRVRHLPLFAVVAVVALAEIVPHSRWADRLMPAGVRPGWRAWRFPAVLVLAACVLHGFGARVPVVGAGWARLTADVAPVEVLPELRRLDAESPPGTPVFNDANFGGFVIYFAPNLRVYADDRCELYPDDWLAGYIDFVSRHPERIDGLRDRHGFTSALVTSGSPLDGYLQRSPAWREVARGKQAALYAAR